MIKIKIMKMVSTGLITMIRDDDGAERATATAAAAVTATAGTRKEGR